MVAIVVLMEETAVLIGSDVAAADTGGRGDDDHFLNEDMQQKYFCTRRRYMSPIGGIC